MLEAIVSLLLSSAGLNMNSLVAALIAAIAAAAINWLLSRMLGHFGIRFAA